MSTENIHNNCYKAIKIRNLWKRKNTKEWVDSRKAIFKNCQNRTFEMKKKDDIISKEMINATLFRAGIPSTSEMSRLKKIQIKKFRKEQEKKSQSQGNERSKTVNVRRVSQLQAEAQVKANKLGNLNTTDSTNSQPGVADIKNVLLKKIMKSFTLKNKKSTDLSLQKIKRHQTFNAQNKSDKKSSPNNSKPRKMTSDKSKEKLPVMEYVQDLLHSQFEIICGTKLTKHNRKYLKFEKSHLEEHISKIINDFPILNKTIPEVTFKHFGMIESQVISLGNSPKISLEEFKDLFYYFCDPQKALKATFDCMLCDLVKCKDGSIFNEYAGRNKGKNLVGVMTVGTIYKFFESNINIQHDIQAITRVFERKKKIISKYKEADLEYTLNKYKRPQTVLPQGVRIHERNKEEEKYSLGGSPNGKKLRSRHRKLRKMDSDVSCVYNNFTNTGINIQTPDHKNKSRTFKGRRRSRISNISNPSSVKNNPNKLRKHDSTFGNLSLKRAPSSIKEIELLKKNSSSKSKNVIELRKSSKRGALNPKASKSPLPKFEIQDVKNEYIVLNTNVRMKHKHDIYECFIKFQEYSNINFRNRGYPDLLLLLIYLIFGERLFHHYVATVLGFGSKYPYIDALDGFKVKY
ncbi:unnamed protein product [Moneuplotes crassus]|uniref:Uncharacterized protein n=1 Tax=Euplotes crassus TaxID=5936 RepID=A0AAD1U4U1_EUPCR|nr:unnamed protein product [Moneuplotes crassus]